MNRINSRCREQAKRRTGRTGTRRTRAGSRLLAALVALLLLLPAQELFAHQPYFEEDDLTVSVPFPVKDPLISTALYATLTEAGDMDFFSFTGSAGARVELGMTIPQIAGQEEFAPTIALIGPGLPPAEAGLLTESEAGPLLADGDGVYVLEPVAATPFYEPFSRTNYWRRQREKVALPADGAYTVVVWSAANQRGRYVLVIGDREVPGGDPLFPLKMSSYWTPLESAGETTGERTGTTTGTTTSAASVDTRPDRSACSWLARLMGLFSPNASPC